MKTIHVSNRGQVLIIFVFAIIGLIAITGLAIDGGNIYSDRRHAQNAADTSTMAGALYRVSQEKYHGASTADCGNIPPTPPLGGYGACASAIINTAKNMANTNGYADNITDSSVEVHTPPVDGPYSDCSKPDLFDCHDYVQVIINTNVNTFFARILGIGQMHNRVEAVALAQYSPEEPLYGGNTLIELATGHGTCPSDFNVGGNAGGQTGSIYLDGGGIFVNSTNTSCAYKQTSCSTTLVLENGATIQIVPPGGADIGSCNGAIVPQSATTSYPFPPTKPIFPRPPECSVPGTSVTSGHTTDYQPGSYIGQGQFPTVSGSSTSNLAPGIYCVDYLQTNKDLNGTGVMIYIMATNSVNLSGGTVKISAPTSGDYAGYLIYGAWNSTSTLQNCGIQGNAGTELTGTIFVPYCKLNISGTTSSGVETQIVAGTITLDGSGDMHFKYDSSKLGNIPEVNRTGLFH